MSAILVLLLVAQFGPEGKPAEPAKPAPAYTAFPDLKPPPPPDPAQGGDFKKAQAAYDQAMAELVFVKLPALPANPTPLQKVRHEQVRAGLDYLRRTKAAMDAGRFDPANYKEYLTVAGDVYKVAAELHDKPDGRVRCYEARVILLKAVERFSEARTTAGADPPQALDSARFARLGAEADLLTLKEEVGKAGKK